MEYRQHVKSGQEKGNRTATQTYNSTINHCAYDEIFFGFQLHVFSDTKQKEALARTQEDDRTAAEVENRLVRRAVCMPVSLHLQ